MVSRCAWVVFKMCVDGVKVCMGGVKVCVDGVKVYVDGVGLDSAP